MPVRAWISAARPSSTILTENDYCVRPSPFTILLLHYVQALLTLDEKEAGSSLKRAETLFSPQSEIKKNKKGKDKSDKILKYGRQSTNCQGKLEDTPQWSERGGDVSVHRGWAAVATLVNRYD